MFLLHSLNRAIKMSNTSVSSQTSVLKTDITNTVDSLKKNSGKLVGLLVLSAKHYWANSESPDVLNHLIKELSSFPTLQKKVINYSCTFGLFEIVEKDGKPDHLINRLQRNDKGELIKESGKAKRVALSDSDKASYKAAIDAFEALQLPRLDVVKSSSKDTETETKTRKTSNDMAVKTIKKSINKFLVTMKANDYGLTKDELKSKLIRYIDEELDESQPVIEGEKA